MATGQRSMPRCAHHGLDLPRAIRRAPAGQFVLELHLDERRHLHRRVDQLSGMTHSGRLQGDDGAPEGQATIDLRQDLGRALLAQLGPGKDLGDLRVEHAVGRRDDRRER